MTNETHPLPNVGSTAGLGVYVSVHDSGPQDTAHSEMMRLLDLSARLAAEIAAALPAMREYARKNPIQPRLLRGGENHDPCGVHAWLLRNERPKGDEPHWTKGMSAGAVLGMP